MNTNIESKWQPGFGIDGVANSLILATGVLAILLAAVTANVETAPEYVQTVQQNADGRATAAASHREV
jgi:hypothetical protein